jgi:flagellar hook assembly protein FlgD
LSVVPPTRTGAYAVRVLLPADVTDASVAHNPLPAVSRCVLVAAGASAIAPTAPTLDTAPATSFSPDGDQTAESVTWKVNLDATASLVRLRITRGDSVVWAKWLPVAGAGVYTFTWDGSDPSGRIVNNGAYGYAIDAVNTAGMASAALRGYVEVNAAAHLVSVWRRQ